MSIAYIRWRTETHRFCKMSIQTPVSSGPIATPLGHTAQSRLPPTSPSSAELSRQMLGLRLNDGEPPTQCVSVPAKTTSCFMLPVLNKQYLMKHTFTEWKELWDFQVAENEPLHLTGPQLKNVLMAHLDTPWRDEILSTFPVNDLPLSDRISSGAPIGSALYSGHGSLRP